MRDPEVLVGGFQHRLPHVGSDELVRVDAGYPLHVVAVTVQAVVVVHGRVVVQNERPQADCFVIIEHAVNNRHLQDGYKLSYWLKF